MASGRAFADSRKNREAAVRLRDVVAQLLNQNGLRDAGAAKQSRLGAFGVRLEKIDDLDAGFEHLDLGRLFIEPRRFTMNRPALFGVDRTLVVDRFAEDVEDTAEGLLADRNGDRRALVDGFHAANHAVGRLHRDARSEEHTSELQSHLNLVCRLLLEKKKK